MPVVVTDGRRSAARQQLLQLEKPLLAASPERSRHVQGRAIDVEPEAAYPWLEANVGRFGLVTGSKWKRPEPWHIQEV